MSFCLLPLSTFFQYTCILGSILVSRVCPLFYLLNIKGFLVFCYFNNSLIDSCPLVNEITPLCLRKSLINGFSNLIASEGLRNPSTRRRAYGHLHSESSVKRPDPGAGLMGVQRTEITGVHSMRSSRPQDLAPGEHNPRTPSSGDSQGAVSIGPATGSGSTVTKP